MEKEIEVSGKKYVLKEVKYKDVVKLSDLSKEEMAKTLLTLSAELSDEDYDNLSMKDGLTLQKEVNKLNGLEDFQKPSVKENLQS